MSFTRISPVSVCVRAHVHVCELIMCVYQFPFHIFFQQHCDITTLFLVFVSMAVQSCRHDVIHPSNEHPGSLHSSYGHTVQICVRVRVDKTLTVSHPAPWLANRKSSLYIFLTVLSQSSPPWPASGLSKLSSSISKLLELKTGCKWAWSVTCCQNMLRVNICLCAQARDTGMFGFYLCTGAPCPQAWSPSRRAGAAGRRLPRPPPGRRRSRQPPCSSPAARTGPVCWWSTSRSGWPWNTRSGKSKSRGGGIRKLVQGWGILLKCRHMNIFLKLCLFKRKGGAIQVKSTYQLSCTHERKLRQKPLKLRILLSFNFFKKRWQTQP